MFNKFVAFHLCDNLFESHLRKIKLKKHHVDKHGGTYLQLLRTYCIITRLSKSVE